ncbi:inosine/xanthosine triphosphatase [Carboxydochorda subterranea]|uniref:Probable inosine/xanthosine triphosphatase n=1 Tax=Carboxydichorda subterranea TaxID=3109565 RepID=A0ABZ1BXD1_9FIRM|nr:inosine/xanthosine triphosphatase [Limnochorda sp. L945t]WRP17363.1 inosine/xanthosine triphosphatase [Limnochorda sp. L945t]
MTGPSAWGPRTVAVGSTNPAKVEAVRQVLRELFGERVALVGVDVPSGVSPQPLSWDETLRGARGRAEGALREVPEATWGVGVEGGVHLEPDGRGWLVTIAAVADRRGRISHGEGLRLLLPDRMVEALRSGQELARVVDAHFPGGDARVEPGAVGYLTRGLITRTQLVRVAVVAALAPRLFPELYPSLAPSGS